MITKITDKNQFNSESWQVNMSSLLHIFIHKTNNKSYLFEFKEWNFFGYKTYLSFVSNEAIESAIITFFDNLYEFTKQNNKWEIDYKKFENFKFKIILHFSENEKDVSKNILSKEEQILIKALNFYSEKKHESVYKILKSENSLLKNNLDAFLILIGSTIKLSYPENNQHHVYYQDAQDYLFELYKSFNKNIFFPNNDQKNKYEQLNEEFKNIPFPEQLKSGDDNILEAFGSFQKKIDFKPNEKALLDANEQIKYGNLEEAYKILSAANLMFEKDVNILFLLTKISIKIKKVKDIPSHIISLITEKEKGNFTKDQEKEFNSILMIYQNNNM